MSFIGVEVQLETTAPPPEKNPGSAPAIRTTVYYNQTLTNSSFLHSQCLFVAVQAPVRQPSNPYTSSGLYENDSRRQPVSGGCLFMRVSIVLSVDAIKLFNNWCEHLAICFNLCLYKHAVIKH